MDGQKTMPERVKQETIRLITEALKTLSRPFIDSAIDFGHAITSLTEASQTLQNAREEATKAEADAVLANMKAVEAGKRVEDAASAMSTRTLQVHQLAKVAMEARDGFVMKGTELLREMGEPEGANDEFMKRVASDESLPWTTRDFKEW